jgi:hypothetical protein
MAVLKYYDGDSWEPVVSALQGPTGATGPTGSTGATGNSAPNKNYLINGSFAVSQRATSFTSTSGANNDDTYTLDRWYILSDGNDAIDITQDTSTVPTNGQFAIALDVETANKKFGIAQIIENKNCLGLIGNTVTFSFKAKVSATTKLDNVKCAIVAWSGTADTVTSDIISAWGAEGTNPTLIANATFENTPANLNVTTGYATYSVTAAVDTASTKNVIVFIWSDVTDTTAGDFLYISEAKLELGSSATAFDYTGNSFSNELAQCQRYYQKSYSQGVAPGTAADFAGAVIWSSVTTGAYGSAIPVYLKTTMRATPTVTIYNPETGTAGSIRGLSAGNNFNGIADYIGDNGFSMYATATQSSAGFLIGTHYAAQIEL